MAITLDVHDIDLPEDITYAADWLAAAGVPATFFIPSSLLGESRYAPALRALPASGHEVASHGHLHDTRETDALSRGRPDELRFLSKSRQLHADFFGAAPVSFRAPWWCALGPGSLDELERLGYAVDSSATPQRLSILGSTPFQGAWALAPRQTHYIRPGLLEVPTSTAFVPAGSSAFLTFRQPLSSILVRMLTLEASLLTDRVVLLQFHSADFNPRSAQPRPAGPLRLGDFVLRRHGGFRFKHCLKDTNRRRIATMTHALVRQVASHSCHVLAELAAMARPECAEASRVTPQDLGSTG